MYWPAEIHLQRKMIPPHAYDNVFVSFHRATALLQIGIHYYCQAFQTTCSDGVWAEVFEYEDVEANIECFEALMAADNLGADLQLPEDALSVTSRIQAAMAGHEPSQWQKAVGKIAGMSSKKWSLIDLGYFTDFAKTTPSDVVHFCQVPVY